MLQLYGTLLYTTLYILLIISYLSIGLIQEQASFEQGLCVILTLLPQN